MVTAAEYAPCCLGSEEQQQQQQHFEGLLAAAAKMLPAPQQGLAIAPSQPGGPALALTTASAAGQVSFCSILCCAFQAN